VENLYDVLCTKFAQESDIKRILQIGLHLPKLWSKVKCVAFLILLTYVFQNISAKVHIFFTTDDDKGCFCLKLNTIT